MGLEDGPLPKKNSLPLDIQKSQTLAQSGESDVWEADVTTSKSEAAKIVLKQNRREEFATDDEMRNSKEYYDYLKSAPGFGKFVPDTLYFKARMTEEESPRAYALQRLLAGKTINRLNDEDLYKDPEVVRQLSEFVDSAIAILQTTRKEWRIKPDFGKSPDDDEHGTHMANVILNPRFSNNILITNVPDEHGQRVFFIDTGQGVRERKEMLWRVFQREYVGRKQESQLEKWKKEIESHANAKSAE